MNAVIREQTIPLADRYEVIKRMISLDGAFSNLKKICTFADDQQSLTFKTEKIHPIATGTGRRPVMLLFSNPHPLSVSTGIFLSEPHSRAFWARLFESQYLSSPDAVWHAIANWDDTTPEVLSEYLINCVYSSQVQLYFDCLEALPTNQYSDLKKLFRDKSGRALRKQTLQDPGFQNLIEVSNQNNISSWIVFSAEAYRRIIEKSSITEDASTIAKNAPNRICKAIDDYLFERDGTAFWHCLGDLRTRIDYEGHSIAVYLSLIARGKHWKADGGENYFTLMIDQILRDILTK